MQSQQQILNNRNNLKRKVNFQTVHYVQGTSLAFKEKQKVSIYRKKMNNTYLNFYLTDKSWL